MILGYVYDILPLPRDLVNIILEFYGEDNMGFHIRKINPHMLNSFDLVKFDLIRLNRIKLPTNISLNNDQNYFNYNNNKFCFSSPWINVCSNPFANPYVNLDKFNKFNLPIGLNKLGNHDNEDFNLMRYSKLDCVENNLLMNFLTRLENKIFEQICKSSNPEYTIIKFNPCILPNEIFSESDDETYDDNNIVGYYYQVKLVILNSITKYYQITKSDGVEIIREINKTDVGSLMRKKVKFLLAPIFKINNKTMNISFIIKQMIIK